MTDKRCPDCKFAIRAAAQLNGPMQCRRNPPSVFMIPIGHGQISMNTTFPQVDATTWCGEFVPKSSESSLPIGTTKTISEWRKFWQDEAICPSNEHLVDDVAR